MPQMSRQDPLIENHTVDYVLGARVALLWWPVVIEYARDAKLLARTSGVCCPPSKESFSIGFKARIF